MAAPTLKDTLFNTDRFRLVAIETRKIEPRFDSARFLKLALVDFETLSLMQRLRRMTESLHAALPASEDYRKRLIILRKLATPIGRGFATLTLPDYVGLYGIAPKDFELSMDALKYFTPFCSSEFAVREFLRRDHTRALAIMETWSRDADEHVRRLASEGCRPRLPWSFHLEAIAADPDLAAPILENLKADPSLYVRKSVANHLNDITKKHPAWVLARIDSWSLENPHTAWIAKQALRTLIKKGDRRALAVMGAGEKARVRVNNFEITPTTVKLGERVTFSFQLESTATRIATAKTKTKKPQTLVVDYAIHYVKKSGSTSRKVFKLKNLTLAAGETITLTRNQRMQDFTTRTHHAGRHEIEIIINGEILAAGSFTLRR